MSIRVLGVPAVGLFHYNYKVAIGSRHPPTKSGLCIGVRGLSMSLLPSAVPVIKGFLLEH